MPNPQPFLQQWVVEGEQPLRASNNPNEFRDDIKTPGYKRQLKKEEKLDLWLIISEYFGNPKYDTHEWWGLNEKFRWVCDELRLGEDQESALLFIRIPPVPRARSRKRGDCKPVRGTAVSTSTVNELFRLYEKGEDIPRRYRERMKHFNLAPQMFPYNHCIGLEIEMEGIPAVAKQDLLQLEEAFQSKGDGSLRNDGQEFVSRYGMTAADVLSYLEPMEKAYSKALFSFRCGLHVHVDVLEHTLEELYKIFLLYSVVEPLMYEVSGKRQENKFCVAVQGSVTSVMNMIYYGHNGQWTEFFDSLDFTTKYMAMNLRPVGRYGTIEFRHHESTVKRDYICDWLFILLDLVVGSKNHDTKELEQRILRLNSSSEYAKFLDDYFPNSSLTMLADFDRKMYSGVAFVKEALVTDPESIEKLCAFEREDA